MRFNTLSALSALFVIFLLTSLVGCAEDVGCTLIGCQDVVEVRFAEPLSANTFKGSIKAGDKVVDFDCATNSSDYDCGAEAILFYGLGKVTAVELHTEPERHMVGLNTLFYSVDSERNNIGQKLPGLWENFVSRLGDINDPVPGICYGIIKQAEPNSELLEYTAAMELKQKPALDKLPAEMTYQLIPEATYATFEHHGEPRHIDQTVNYVYANWLLQSGKRHSCGPDIETYGQRYIPDSPDSVMLYAIPVA